MGDIYSVPSRNPSDTHNPIHMSSPEPSHNPLPQSGNAAIDAVESQSPARDADPSSSEGDTTHESEAKTNIEEGDRVGEDGEEEEEEEGECGFCLFMKGGGCRDTFIAWEKCIEDAEEKNEDIVDKCFEVTGNLKKCMEAHSDYYAPILQAEKAAEQEVTRELQKEKEMEASASFSTKNSSDENSSEGSEERISQRS